MLDFRATPTSGVAEVLLLGSHQENAGDASPAGGTSPEPINRLKLCTHRGSSS
jgi:hypothetical protein